MVALFCLGMSVVVVLVAVGIFARLAVAGLWALVLAAFLGWLAVSPDPRIFPAVWWLLAAWVLMLGLRVVRRGRWVRVGAGRRPASGTTEPVGAHRPRCRR